MPIFSLGFASNPSGAAGGGNVFVAAPLFGDSSVSNPTGGSGGAGAGSGPAALAAASGSPATIGQSVAGASQLISQILPWVAVAGAVGAAVWVITQLFSKPK